jgi:hypothetical protein
MRKIEFQSYVCSSIDGFQFLKFGNVDRVGPSWPTGQSRAMPRGLYDACCWTPRVHALFTVVKKPSPSFGLTLPLRSVSLGLVPMERCQAELAALSTLPYRPSLHLSIALAVAPLLLPLATAAGCSRWPPTAKSRGRPTGVHARAAQVAAVGPSCATAGQARAGSRPSWLLLVKAGPGWSPLLPPASPSPYRR